MEHYFNSQSFVRDCEHGYNIETYVSMNIAKDECLDLTSAKKISSDPDIYTAEYDVIGSDQTRLYSLVVTYKVSTNEYSCHRSL